MPSNSFGSVFRITTFGESHGPMIGVVIDGCPAGIALDVEEVQSALDRRAPGRTRFTSPRKEADRAEIVSGLFEGHTTGAPICIQIANKDADPSKYDALRNLLRPGHANYTYIEKYGLFDHRGGGRASARETAARVAAGAVAAKLLRLDGIEVVAYLKELGGIVAQVDRVCRSQVDSSPIFCPDQKVSKEMERLLDTLTDDSVGGVVEMVATGVPVGLGDPIYEKIEAQLAYGIMSLPAVKGFEIGSGFSAARMRGSQHNDQFTEYGVTATNHAGGALGGITTGMPIVVRAALKPTSSIKQVQKTVDMDGNRVTHQLPEGSRHDPCVAIRAVPVIEAMGAIVLADRLLKQRLSRIGSTQYKAPQ